MQYAFDPPAPSRQLLLVTGGTKGIGHAAALTLADLGHDVWVTGRTPPPERRDNIEFMPCDFSEPAQVEQLVRHILGRGRRIDVLLHNAATITAASRTTGRVTTDGLVNVLAPTVLTESLGQHGQLGRMVVVLAGARHDDSGPVDPSALQGVAGYFRGKQLLAAALSYVALRHGVACHFFRPPGTNTGLQTKILDTLPLRRPGWLISTIEWLNRRSLRNAHDVGERLAHVALNRAGLGPLTLSTMHANVPPQALAIKPAEAARCFDDVMRTWCTLTSDTSAVVLQE